MDAETDINISERLKTTDIEESSQDMLTQDVDIHAKSDRRKGILNAIGGVFLMFYLGCFFLWGNIDVYVLSYFYQFNP